VIVVVDSGVWISALHFGGTPLAALNHVFLSEQLAICDQIVIEIRAVLTRNLSLLEIATFLPWDYSEIFVS
jgi:hypothetical protein